MLLVIGILFLFYFFFFFFLMIRRPPRSTLFPSRRSSDPALRADVDIYRKAVEYILRFPEEFATPAFVADTRAVLDTGLTRARELEAPGVASSRPVGGDRGRRRLHGHAPVRAQRQPAAVPGSDAALLRRSR